MQMTQLSAWYVAKVQHFFVLLLSKILKKVESSVFTHFQMPVVCVGCPEEILNLRGRLWSYN